MEKTVKGKVLDESQEVLLSNTEKRRKEVNEAAEILNTIKLPCNATFYSHGMVWNIRNVAFWESLKKKDKEFLNLINITAK